MRVLFVLALLAWPLLAESFVVAANPKLPIERLSRKTLAELYLDKRRRVHDQRLVLLNLALHDPVRLSFEKRVLGVSRAKLQHYWLKAHFQGRRPPKVVASEEAAARYIAKIDNAIGYMHAKTAKTHGLKILYEWQP